MESAVRLKDVARACNLAVSTVSLALRNSGTVSQATCQRVQQVARQLGYRPDPLFASLRARNRPQADTRSGVPIALVRCAEPSDQHIDRELVFTTARARELGYALRLVMLDPGKPQLAECLDHLYHQGVVGILIGQWNEPDPQWPGRWDRFAVVALSGNKVRCPFHIVRNAAFAHCKLAWERCIQAGYTAIGAAIGRHNVPFEDDDLRECATWFIQRGLPPQHRLIPPLLAYLEDEAPFLEWFRAHRPDAIIGFSCFHYYRLLRTTEFRCPRDFAYCALHVEDDHPSYDAMAGVLDNRLEVCRAALEFLDQLIRHHQYGVPASPRTVQIPAIWREGPSLPPASAQASTPLLPEFPEVQRRHDLWLKRSWSPAAHKILSGS